MCVSTFSYLPRSRNVSSQHQENKHPLLEDKCSCNYCCANGGQLKTTFENDLALSHLVSRHSRESRDSSNSLFSRMDTGSTDDDYLGRQNINLAAGDRSDNVG